MVQALVVAVFTAFLTVTPSEGKVGDSVNVAIEVDGNFSGQACVDIDNSDSSHIAEFCWPVVADGEPVTVGDSFTVGAAGNFLLTAYLVPEDGTEPTQFNTIPVTISE